MTARTFPLVIDKTRCALSHREATRLHTELTNWLNDDPDASGEWLGEDDAARVAAVRARLAASTDRADIEFIADHGGDLDRAADALCFTSARDLLVASYAARLDSRLAVEATARGLTA